MSQKSTANYSPDVLSGIQKVAIWGASLSGEDCLRQLTALGIRVSFFVDSRPPEEHEFHGYEVKTPSYLLQNQYKPEDVDCIILAMGNPSVPLKLLKETASDLPIVKFRQGSSLIKILKGNLCLNSALRLDNSPEDQVILNQISSVIRDSATQGNVAIYGAGKLYDCLIKYKPELREYITCIIDDALHKQNMVANPPIVGLNESLTEIKTIIICSKRFNSYSQMRRRASTLQPDINVITITTILEQMARNKIPSRAWIEPVNTIYPVDVPEIKLDKGLDFALVDAPPRFLGMMPNGLAYVHNILKQTGIKFQTLDLDLIYYHRYHQERFMDNIEEIRSPSGYLMSSDPWAMDTTEDEWSKDEVIEYFSGYTEEAVNAIVTANPKVLGLSLHGTNLPISTKIVQRVRELAPNIIIVVGGYDCIRPELGPIIFPDFDYMVIFEAETSLGVLAKKLAAGERPKNLPGIISKHDNPLFKFVPATLVEDLDTIEFPKYEWADINLYRNYNGYQLTPIVLTRGCRWSKCTFCAERFNWRKRSAQNMVDEIEWLRNKGCKLFHFNDSDLSGDPDTVQEMCEEIIKRGINDIMMVGQLRVQKGYTQEYFNILSKAGFTSLRYGIDGWAKNTLKLHRKGYTLEMIEDVIKYTKTSGIHVSINLVIGIPYETEEDIDETIINMLKNKPYFDRIENLNTLILANGGMYWEDPEKYGIHFKRDKTELYNEFPRMIPTQFWHSTKPYIDQDVRLKRLTRLVEAALDAGIDIGSYASWKVKKIGVGSESSL